MISTFIPSLENPFSYEYFDLEGGQMPPISTDCQYGFTDMLYMANSLEKSTNSYFYFKPILADNTCFLRMHSTSTAQGAYIDSEKVTVNYGFDNTSGKNLVLIFYTLIFLFFTKNLSKKEFTGDKFNYFPYLFSLPIFIYESFTILNILIYSICLYLIGNRQKEINIEKFPYIFFLSFIFPLTIFNSQISVWFMFLISYINKEIMKNKFFQIAFIFLITPAVLLNNPTSLELNNNFNNQGIFSNLFYVSELESDTPTYLSSQEINSINRDNQDLSYYQIHNFSMRIGGSSFPLKNLLFLSKSPDILASLIVALMHLSLLAFVLNYLKGKLNKSNIHKISQLLSYGGIITVTTTFFLGINEFLNNNLTIITGSLRKVEAIPEIFSTDWRGLFYSAEGAGELFMIFTLCGVYNLKFKSKQSNKLTLLVSLLFSIYGLLLTSSSSSIILTILGASYLILNKYIEIKISKFTLLFIILLLLIPSFIFPTSEIFDERIAVSESSSSQFINSLEPLRISLSSTSNLINREIPWSGFFESYNPNFLEVIIGNSSGSISESWAYHSTQHNPHSYLFYIIYSYGLVGVFLYLYILFTLINKLSRKKNYEIFFPLLTALILINNLKSDNLILFSNAFLFCFIFVNSIKSLKSSID
jgi:hypothetical protein